LSTDPPDSIREPGESGRAAALPRPYWIGGLLVLMGAVWLRGGLALPQGARYAAVGPGLAVTIVGGVLILLGLILVVQIARGERFEPQDAEEAAAGGPMDRRAFLMALAGVGLPVATMERLGLPLTATLSFALVARAFGSRRLPSDLAIGAALATAAWFLFRRLGLQLGDFFPPAGI
jgi:putative tricarboxylic transport membrane protein